MLDFNKTLYKRTQAIELPVAYKDYKTIKPTQSFLPFERDYLRRPRGVGLYIAMKSQKKVQRPEEATEERKGL